MGYTWHSKKDFVVESHYRGSNSHPHSQPRVQIATVNTLSFIAATRTKLPVSDKITDAHAEVLTLRQSEILPPPHRPTSDIYGQDPTDTHEHDSKASTPPLSYKFTRQRISFDLEFSQLRKDYFRWPSTQSTDKAPLSPVQHCCIIIHK